ncbi:MAG: ArsI/CadI family heavy metal resistance metalloenzyme [Pseudomonadota bacterium]
MKRFHVHVGVIDIPSAVAFYSRLFDAEPTVVESDYAKWMLDEPRLNFAVSTRAGKTGLDHLGFQAENEEELEVLHRRVEAAAGPVVEQKGTACCYAESDKYWTMDPAGIAWENFHTLGRVPVFGTEKAAQGSACCAPMPAQVSLAQLKQKFPGCE